MRTFLFIVPMAIALIPIASGQEWMAMGTGGSVRASAQGAVELSYEASQFAAAVLPVSGSFASMKSFRFRAKSDRDTTLGVVLSERKPGGGNYVALFWSPANTWQQIELTPRDFDVADGPTDPVDADGKLDLDQVEGVAIFDLAAFLGKALDREKIVVATATGSHSISIDNFEVRSTAPADDASALDTFSRGFLQWMSPGGMALKFVPETGPLGEPSMKATYTESSGPYAVVVRRVKSREKAKGLSFDIASENEATIGVSIETKQGARFFQTIYPPAGRKVFHVDLSFADFEKEGGGAPDQSDTFDPARWKSIAITDVSGANVSNTFWLGNLRVKDE
jgi:hypothetical protein